MCPACITTVAWIAAGAASTGGLAALVARAASHHPGATRHPSSGRRGVSCGGKGDEASDEFKHDQGDGNGNAECGITR